MMIVSGDVFFHGRGGQEVGVSVAHEHVADQSDHAGNEERLNQKPVDTFGTPHWSKAYPPAANHVKEVSPLDLAPRGQVYPRLMSGNGLLIGEVAKRSGASRKALRLYEAAGILASPRRTSAGYRVYDPSALELLSFIQQAQRLGFTLDEIREIVAIKRAGRTPCPHVRDLVRRKAQELDRKLTDLMEVRDGLRTLLRGWRSARQSKAIVCPHIEHRPKKG